MEVGRKGENRKEEMAHSSVCLRAPAAQCTDTALDQNVRSHQKLYDGHICCGNHMQAGQAPIESAQSGRGGGNEDGGQAKIQAQMLFYSFHIIIKL